MDVWLFWIFLVFMSCFLLQLFYFLVLYYFFPSEKMVRDDIALPNISIVLAVKNEEAHMNSLLDALQAQDYPHFEVVLIDDHSTDESLKKISAWKERHPNFLLKYSSNHLSGKKSALNQGIALANGEWIALTDADCRPSPLWLKTMMQSRGQSKVIIGYGPYFMSNNLVGCFQQYETWLIALQYFSFSRLGFHYMAVGRNMMFKKEIFEEFSSDDPVLSGSDDLLVQKFAKKHTIEYQFDPSSHVYSFGKTSWMDLWHQKKRHISTSPRYSFRIQSLLGMLFVSHSCFYISGIALICLGSYSLLIGAILLLRFFCLGLVIYFGTQKLYTRQRFWLYPIFDILIVFYYISLSFTLLFKSKRW